MKTKTVFISGAAKGIGASCAKAFAKEGYNVIINYLHSEKQALDLCEELEQTYKISTLCLKGDVSDYNQTQQMFLKAYEIFLGIDVLVNNAGISLIKLLSDTSKDEWDKIISTNLTSIYNTCSAVVPHMVKNHKGSIVNISSMWGQIGASCEVAYSASKAGVIGFTKALAKELAPSDIRVNCIAPGVIMTDMMNECDDETIKQLKEETPLGTLGQPEDVARAVVFLSSDKASFITGQIIGVNGGMII